MHFDGEPPLPLKEGWLTKVQGIPPSGTTIVVKVDDAVRPALEYACVTRWLLFAFSGAVLNTPAAEQPHS